MKFTLFNTYNNALNVVRNVCYYKQTVYSVAESAFFLFFAKFMGGVVSDRVLQSLKTTGWRSKG